MENARTLFGGKVPIHVTPAGDEHEKRKQNHGLLWNCRNRTTRSHYQRQDNIDEYTDATATRANHTEMLLLRQESCIRTTEVHRVHRTVPGRRHLLKRRFWQHTEPAKTPGYGPHLYKYMTLHDNPQTHDGIRTQRLLRKKTLRIIYDVSLGRLCPNFLKVNKRDKIKTRQHVPNFVLPTGKEDDA